MSKWWENNWNRIIPWFWEIFKNRIERFFIIEIPPNLRFLNRRNQIVADTVSFFSACLIIQNIFWKGIYLYNLILLFLSYVSISILSYKLNEQYKNLLDRHVKHLSKKIICEHVLFAFSGLKGKKTNNFERRNKSLFTASPFYFHIHWWKKK